MLALQATEVAGGDHLSEEADAHQGTEDQHGFLTAEGLAAGLVAVQHGAEHARPRKDAADRGRHHHALVEVELLRDDDDARLVGGEADDDQRDEDHDPAGSGTVDLLDASGGEPRAEDARGDDATDDRQQADDRTGVLGYANEVACR